MAMLNIGGDTGDAFYRYKMPKLVAKVEGRGNGIKTNVVNNVDIAKALERPPEYIIKYFGCELGAQTNYEAKTGTSIVNGAHDSGTLAKLLEGFIKKYVQCYSCGNPETVVKVKKELISLKCKACGYVSDVDPRHKLNTFIIKNPPDNKLSKEEKRLKKVEEERLKGAEVEKKKEKKDKGDKEKKEKKDKKDKKKKKDDEANEDDAKPEADGEAPDENGDADEDEEDDDVVWLTDTSEAAIKKRAAEQLTAATAAMVTQGNIEAEQEEAKRKAKAAAKKEAEAAAKRAEELAKRAQKISLNDVPDEKLDVEAATDVLEVCLIGMEPAVAAKALKMLNVEGGPVAKARALIGAAFRSTKDHLVSVIKAKKAVFKSADAAAQLALLIAFEHFAGVEQPTRVKEVPHVLKLLYDEDLADEDVIVAWFDKVEAGKILQVPKDAAKLVRQHAAPVVQWLQEEEDDEDEE